jgi:hypothetical protein
LSTATVAITCPRRGHDCDVSSEPDIVFHYTDAPGLSGIVGTQTVWLTDSAFLNDAQESLYARDALRHLLEQAIEEAVAGEDPLAALVSGAAENALLELERPSGEEATRMSTRRCLDPAGNYLRHQPPHSTQPTRG